MIRNALPLAALTAALVLPSLLSAQNTLPRGAALETWIRTQMPGKTRVTLPALLQAARQKGLVTTAAEQRELKREFRRFALERGRSGRVLQFAPRQVPASQLPMATTEAEYNDTAAYANLLGPLTPVATTAQGSIGAGESDVFGFDVLADGTVTFAMTSSNSNLDYVLLSERGEYLEWGETNFPSFELPKGRYYVGLWLSSGTANYSLALTYAANALTTLAPNTSTPTSLSSTPRTFRVVVPGDGRVSLRLTSTGSADTYLFLYNAKMRYMFDVDDDSRSTVDAGLNAQLPAGTYYVTITSDVPTTTQIAYGYTAGSISTLVCNGPAISGNIPGGQEDFDLYRVIIPQAQAETLAITATGSSPIMDSYLVLFDKEMAFAVESDEGTPASSLSNLTVTLPAGIYYAASTGYYDYGSYSISRSCGTAASTSAFAGHNAGNITAQSTAQTFVFDLRTPVPVEWNVVEQTLFDAMIGIVDAKTGLSLGHNDFPWNSLSCNISGPVPDGQYYVIVKDWDGGTGTFDLEVLAPLYRDATNRLRGLDHAGDVIVFLASGGTIPPINPLPGLTEGYFLLDPLSLLSFSVVVPTSGQLDWVATLPRNSGVHLQHVSFSVTTLTGEFSNRLD